MTQSNQETSSESVSKDKSLYIRFGDIPEGERSSSWRGDTETGKEAGVSVYNLAIGADGKLGIVLSLPVTKSSLHTLQHLLEYDSRPVYIVSGECVGHGSDNEPLIEKVEILQTLREDELRRKERDI